MANFKEAYGHTGAAEGGYSNHASDRGGETWKGIARKKHPQWDGWALVDAIKAKAMNIGKALAASAELAAKVEAFYKSEFWDVLRLDQMPTQAVANELFDTAVNQGVATAAKYLQQAVNLLNQNGLLYKDLKEDGNLGAVTLAAYQAIVLHYRSKYGQAAIEATILKALNGLQFERYRDICANDPTQETFFFGWVTNRI